MAVDAALYSGSKCYFFSGDRYVRVARGESGAGSVDPGYPASISAWGWPAGFGASGIDAALYSGSKCYFFSGDRYVRVTRGESGAGSVDPGYPASISAWGWPAGFGASGIDAALYSGSKCYFFSGDRYVRVTRGESGAGSVDPGYPASISAWGWPAGFGASGIDAALYSGSKCYFFSGDRYVRVTRGESGAGSVDPGYPASISAWGWPAGFGASQTLIRRNVWELGGDWADEILWYARGVAAMKARSLTDPTSWRFYAGMHGFDSSRWQELGYLFPTDQLPSQALLAAFWRQCQHGSWHFLPWHRGYVLALKGTSGPRSSP